MDDIPLSDEYLKDELLQACRRKFYKPEYIACPGCGRTMYNLQETFEEDYTLLYLQRRIFGNRDTGTASEGFLA